MKPPGKTIKRVNELAGYEPAALRWYIVNVTAPQAMPRGRFCPPIPPGRSSRSCLHSTPEYVEAMLDAEASGHVLKDTAGMHLLTAIGAVLAGQTTRP